MRSFVLSFLAFFTLSCAAQSSFKGYYDARDLLDRARKLDPTHPFIPRAEVELDAGRTALNEARYSKATRSFRTVSREAEKIIVAKDPRYKPVFIETEEPTPDIRDRRPLPPTPQPVVAEEAPAPVVEQPSRMKLPAEALARYLSQKKASPIEKKAPVQPTTVQPPTKTLPPPKAEARQPKQEPVAPARAPVQEAKPKELQDELKPLPHKKTKLDVILTFVPNEAGILPGARDELDRMSRYLLENPSNTLVLRPALAVGESADLAKARFEGVRSYIEGKGVPVDQVQLDAETISATTPLFQLYLIEH